MSFKKIVSDLSFSPAMMGQLSLLANKIKKEELTRRIGLLLLITSLIIQSLIILQPAGQTNSLSSGEMIARGYETDDKCLTSTNFACIKDLSKSITATNLSHGKVDAETVVAEAGDHISYTVSFTNTGSEAIKAKPQIRLADVIEYSELIQASGGKLDITKNILSWDETTINPNSTQTRTFVISLFDKIPTTSRGKYYTKSHDCQISSSFGNKINIAVNCSLVKDIENIYLNLPHLGTINTVIISIFLLLVVIYHYLIARQIKKEIQIIRHNANAGTI